jgi:DNA-binding NtrC family response regulator
MLEVLVVDDDPAVRMAVAYALADAGHNVVEACDGEEALTACTGRAFDVAICDVRLPKVDGLTLFRHLRQRMPSTAVILMTAYATVADAVATLREGAYDYVLKPFDSEEFTLRVIGRISERRALRQELEAARAQLASREVGAKLVGQSPAITRIIEQIDTLAQSDAPVLITGESGTGKELVARTLHARGPRRGRPFVAINCTALTGGMVEAELFGRERGEESEDGDDSAQTQELMRRLHGRLAEADGGTLYLEEVAALPLPAQARLSRALESRTVERPGTTPLPLNVRVISSARADLRDATEQGKLLDGLFYRLNVLDVVIPPLRERRADMPLLLGYFLEKFTGSGKVPPGISPAAWSALIEHPFPGNVREFAHAIERALVLSRGSEIAVEHLPEDIAGRGSVHSVETAAFRPLGVAAKEFERRYLVKALELSGGKRMRAAELLGLSRKTLWEKLKAHGITSAGEAEKEEN